MKRALAILALCLVPAFGQDDPLYADGKYEAAIKADLARNDGEGFAMAARAALADEGSRSERCLACIKLAESYARKAIAAAPKDPDGRVYLAIALGLESRIEGYGVARRKGYADQAKQALEDAYALAPKNVWVLAGLGGWNIEVVRGGGAVLAYLLYGATVERGRALFDEALRLAPDNIVLRYQYALTLSGYAPDRFRAEIDGLLAQAAEGRADTAYDRLLQSRARKLLALLRKGDREGFAAHVRSYEGYPAAPAG